VGGTWNGVLVSHLVPATGYATLYFLGVLSAVEHSMEEEARTLGATRWQALWRVTIPVLRRRLADAFVLAALVSWGQLALTLLVGGGAVRTLPVELLSYVRAGDDRVGALAALLLTVPPLLALGLLQAGATRTGAST
jgi:putative spermidine/putrescine transport system permease protein